MITVCLQVITIVGLYCVQGAAPPPEANCGNVGDNTLICSIQAEEVPLRASWYDPDLGGINCMEPCDLLMDGLPVEEGYGWVLGCPEEWFRDWLTIEHAGRWQCRDTGYTTFVRYGRVYSQDGWETVWYIHVDFLAHEPPSFAYFLLDWQRDDAAVNAD